MATMLTNPPWEPEDGDHKGAAGSGGGSPSHSLTAPLTSQNYETRTLLHELIMVHYSMITFASRFDAFPDVLKDVTAMLSTAIDNFGEMREYLSGREI